MNKKLEYGVMALLYLGDEQEKIASVKEISTRYHIPENLLSKVMQLMKNVGIVSPVHGNQGGYRLTKSLNEINLLQLSTVLVGPVQIADCLHPGKGECPAQAGCSIISPMEMLNQKIAKLLETTSLDNLARRI